MDKYNYENLNEKEKRILDVAIKIFSEKGFNATSTNEIAKKAKVAEGTIFRYFKTKKGILRGIMIQLINIFSDKLVFSSIEKIFKNSDDKDLRIILKEILVDRVNLVDKIFPMARIVLIESIYQEEIREALFENIIKKALEMYGEFHLEMQNKNKIRKEIDADVALRLIVANIMIFIGQRKLYKDNFNLKDDDIEKDIDVIIDLIMRGISC
ncbi:MAG: helix-turn-helix domain-containing protein [Clostridiales bacterium]